MKKYLPVIIIGIAIIAAVLLVANSRFQNNGAMQDANEKALVSPGSFGTQTNSEGGVTVSVLPKTISGSVWEFNITLDTHSGALDEDMVAASVLADDAGKEYASFAWEGDSAGGHHRAGILKFRVPTQKPETIKLVIRGIGGIEERVFMWRVSL